MPAANTRHRAWLLEWGLIFRFPGRGSLKEWVIQGVTSAIFYALRPESSDVYAFVRASLPRIFAGGFLHSLEQ